MRWWSRCSAAAFVAGAAATVAASVIAFHCLRRFGVQPTPSRAAEDDAAIRAVAQTHLAYVVTGNEDVDNIVKSGLAGLTLFLAQRTALEAGDPSASIWRATSSRSSR